MQLLLDWVREVALKLNPEQAQSLFEATFKNLKINIDLDSNGHLPSNNGHVASTESTTMAQPTYQQSNTADAEEMEVLNKDINVKWNHDSFIVVVNNDSTFYVEEMEVSEKRRLAFLVANSYKESKTLDPLSGTDTSIQNVKNAIKQHGFEVSQPQCNLCNSLSIIFLSPPSLNC